MKTAAIVTIVAMIAAVGTIGIIAGAPAAEAQQRLAPGQTECNPGQSDSRFCGPPGQRLLGNPGQCQNTLDIILSKDLAHDLCH